MRSEGHTESFSISSKTTDEVEDLGVSWCSSPSKSMLFLLFWGRSICPAHPGRTTDPCPQVCTASSRVILCTPLFVWLKKRQCSLPLAFIWIFPFPVIVTSQQREQLWQTQSFAQNLCLIPAQYSKQSRMNDFPKLEPHECLYENSYTLDLV